LLHNTGYVAAKLDAMFLPFRVIDLSEFAKLIPEFGLRGISVTIPHKQTVMKYLHDCEPMAERIGAINTIVVAKNGRLHGSNTDYLGVLRALEGKLELGRARALIFGAGGSARAAAFALTQAGAEVLICARREPAARSLARACGAQVIPRSRLKSARFDLIVNATPVGMHPDTGLSPLSPGELHTRLVMDLIYRPIETKLLQMAAKKRVGAISGVEMFLAQGFAQWERFMGQRAPEAAMRRAVLDQLRHDESR
jgi:3-dehydroquinate dehydratase/shikimate dehydrogenase